jgi:predicted HicB family RNase H-like nuclease
MKDMMEYKGYLGSVHYNDEDEVFHGKLEFIRALVSYEGTHVTSLRNAFREAVDDYMELCQERGEKPETPFKGTFNIRTGSDLHRRASIYAKSRDTSLNQLVTTALEKFLADSKKSKSNHHPY